MIMNILAKTVLYASGLIGVTACIVLAFLIIPGTPKSTPGLQFQGYVVLPKGKGASGVLRILDYLTVVDRNLFVANDSNGDVYRVKLAATSIPAPKDVSLFSVEPKAHGVAVDPATHAAFVTRSEANTVDAFDPETMRVLRRIPVAADPDAILYDSVDKLMYVSNGDTRVGTLIDPSTKTKVGIIPLGGEPEFSAFDPQTKLIYQNLKDTNTVAVVDVAKRMVIQRWPLPSCRLPTSATIDVAERRLFVVCALSARFLALDLETHRVVASLPIGGLTDSVVYDPQLHRIYTAGDMGIMSVIQEDSPNTYHVVESIYLHVLAHTLAIDPATHYVYAGYAGLFIQPRLAIFTAR